MGWLLDVLSLNAKVFSLLSDVESINKRIEKVDDEVRGLGRELAQLKGYLAAAQFTISKCGSVPVENMREIQDAIDGLAKRLDLKETPKLNDKSGSVYNEE